MYIFLSDEIDSVKICQADISWLKLPLLSVIATSRWDEMLNWIGILTTPHPLIWVLCILEWYFWEVESVFGTRKRVFLLYLTGYIQTCMRLQKQALPLVIWIIQLQYFILSVRAGRSLWCRAKMRPESSTLPTLLRSWELLMPNSSYMWCVKRTYMIWSGLSCFTTGCCRIHLSPTYLGQSFVAVHFFLNQYYTSYGGARRAPRTHMVRVP